MPTTDQPTNITASSATLNGTLNDLQGASSLDVYFEWGTDTTYGNTTATQTISSVPTSFSADISGLTALTTYHYRAVSTDGSTTWTGDDVSFIASDLRDADKTQADFAEGTLTNVEADAGGYLRLADTDVLSFDGIDDYVDCGNNFSIGTSNFSIECWVKVTKTATRIIFGNSDGDYGFHFQTQDDNTVSIWTNPTSHLPSNYILPLSEWHHLAISVDRSSGWSVQWYIDGQSAGSGTHANTASIDANPYIIGLDPRDLSGYGTEGNIQDLRLWNTTRTQTEIQDNMYKRLTGDETGLVAYYKLDEGTGTTATDSAGTNDGTLTNGPTWVANEPLYFMNPAEDNNRLSPQIDLSSLGTIDDTLIKWTETLNSQTITIETRVSLDGGSTWTAWATATNDSTIPDLSNGTDVSNGLLECRQTLSTSDVAATPELHSLNVAFTAAILDITLSLPAIQSLSQISFSEINIFTDRILDVPTIKSHSKITITSIKSGYGNIICTVFPKNISSINGISKYDIFRMLSTP